MCASTEYSATRRHASVVGDMFVSCKVHGLAVKQGGTADKLFIRPWQNVCRGFFYFDLFVRCSCEQVRPAANSIFHHLPRTDTLTSL